MSLRFADMPDENLMDFIHAGHVRAFETLVERHHTRFYNMSYRWLLHAEDAEDLVQDAFLKLWSGKARWKAKKKARFTTWFYRVLYNMAMDKLRSRRYRFTEVSEHLADLSPDAEDLYEKKQHQEALLRLLYELPEKQRIAVSLFYFEAMSQKEIARTMGITVKALESHLVRARHSLRDAMGAYDHVG